MTQKSLLHRAYLVTIFVKGFDGGLELLLGLIISLFGPDRLYAFVLHVTAPEIYDRPHSTILQGIQQIAGHLFGGPSGFIITYLLVHGILKVWLAVTLLKGGARWIFPVGSLILAGFILFMGLRLAEQWSNWLLGFAIFDAITLALVLNEWRQPARSI